MLLSQSRVSAMCCALMMLLLKNQPAQAGAISDGLQMPDLCDQRKDITELEFTSWCTQQLKETIAKSCYVVIDQYRRDGQACNWQGCRYLSLVGRAPTLSGGNFVEYGLATPTDGATYRTRSSLPLPNGTVLPAGTVMPKDPYRRVYITASEAKVTRAGCPVPPSTTMGANPANLPIVQYNKICNPDPELADFMDINPYWRCMMSP